MNKRNILTGTLAGVLLMAGASAQAAFTLPSSGYVTYGDANSYALAVLAAQYDHLYGGGVGPGNPYYVASSPGAIKDTIVVATGASGTGVNTNFAGMDNAYPTPNDQAGTIYFSTGTTADPTPTGSWDLAGTWDTSISAFKTFLNGESPIFFFNNNQVNSGASTNQNLAAWAQITLTSSTGASPLYFDLTNFDPTIPGGGAYAEPFAGGGGVYNGDPSVYTSTGAGPVAGTNAATDYVLSGGQVCLNATSYAPEACGATAGQVVINNNLGANQAAYALTVPELNAILADPNSPYDALHMEVRLGCDPATPGYATNSGDCVGRSINNGYEQIFIATQTTVPEVPEPASVALMGLGLLGMGLVGMSSRRRNRE